MIQRILDIFFSLMGLILFSPVFLIISFLIKLNSSGSVFFIQKRVGLSGKIFKIIKFRTMKMTDNRNNNKLTIGNNDSRITRIGIFLRKFKIDELPQLFNVLKGEMSLVGPRPEVPEYVKYYSEKEKQVLSIKPGLTDMASIKYINENELLAKSDNPEKEYIEVIMKEKLKLNFDYLRNYNLKNYFKIIILTFKSLFYSNI